VNVSKPRGFEKIINTSAAKHDYPGGLFTRFFSYRKNGVSFVLRDAHSIAKRYTSLQAQVTYDATSAADGGHGSTY
jgi:hypothetical protein